METSKDKMELVQTVIKQLMEDEKKGNKNGSSSSDESTLVAVDDDEGHHHLLSKLLSQLETLRDDELKQHEPSTKPEEIPFLSICEQEPKSETATEVDGGDSKIEREDIVKELRKIKRQNFITQCLLSAMIVLTVAWQLSEVSLILKVKNGLSNPLRSFRSMLAGMLKGPNVNGQTGDTLSTVKPKLVEGSTLPALRIPELPHLELPVSDFKDNDE
ncbi:unnamed protein product [Ilex paraguariensis]|uniref:Transmembrane protein n=1 Tax=Ilex paraguariensis TaxID=185542 RepID=A0ABC8QXZ8_9AQUA